MSDIHTAPPKGEASRRASEGHRACRSRGLKAPPSAKGGGTPSHAGPPPIRLTSRGEERTQAQGSRGCPGRCYAELNDRGVPENQRLLFAKAHNRVDKGLHMHTERGDS